MSVGTWDLGKEMVENDENHDRIMGFNRPTLYPGTLGARGDVLTQYIASTL